MHPEVASWTLITLKKVLIWRKHKLLLKLQQQCWLKLTSQLSLSWLCSSKLTLPSWLGLISQAPLKATGVKSGGFLSCAPSMGALLRVQVPSQVDHDERSEAQLHEGDRVWEGSVEHKL